MQYQRKADPVAPENMKDYLEKAMEYADYISMIDSLLAQGKTTGPEQSDVLFGYARLNRQRMKRLGNTVELGDAVVAAARVVEREIVWLIITEGWCGDAAQNIPVIEKIAHVNPKIRTRYILRDENPDLMDAFLTNGARSIPKLIAVEVKSGEILGTWGPRPEAAMSYFLEMRENGLAKTLIMENLQRWYIRDKEGSIQREFEQLLINWAGERGESAAAENLREVEK